MDGIRKDLLKKGNDARKKCEMIHTGHLIQAKHFAHIIAFAPHINSVRYYLSYFINGETEALRIHFLMETHLETSTPAVCNSKFCALGNHLTPTEDSFMGSKCLCYT